jgi:hypothetical protein
LTEGKLPSGRTPSAWIDKRVLGSVTDDIQSVQVVHADGEQLSISRNGRADDDFVLSGLSEAEEVESIYAVNNIARTLQSLTTDDIIPVDEIKLGTDPTEVQVDTFEGIRINIAFYKQEDKIYARLTAAHPANQEGSAQAMDNIGVLEDRWQPWIYVIPEHQYDAVTVKKTDLIKANGPEPEPKA